MLKKVRLNADVYAACLQHALSAEKEEVMGILIGTVDEDEAISNISALKILSRLDKKPDRVEISVDQLLSATEYAETLSKRLNQNLRALGWYHSHPHITVWPSHVDVGTQGLYQLMDPYFVGLIFSVYPKNAGSDDNQISITAFQQSQNERREIEIEIISTSLELYNLEAMASLPNLLIDEETQAKIDDTNNEDILISLHNDAYKTLNHVNIMANITRPICDAFEHRLENTERDVERLERRKRELLQML